MAKLAIERCRQLACFSEQPGRISRTFLSPPMHDCHRQIASWLEPLKAEVSIDAAGNLRALYPATDTNAPRLLIGSHLDTVPDAGAFDGVLGVILGVTLLEASRGKRLPFGIELVGFSEEEGVRFGVPFIGSRALMGRLDDDLLRHEDERGVSVRTAIEQFGLNPADISAARLRGEILGYVEFHLEQGPVLDESGLPLCAVEAVAGQSKLEFTFLGCANHAGTTPMHLRRDAISGAAEWIVAVEREAQRVQGLVATVGTVEVKPGAANVIAGETRLALDVRHRADDVRQRSEDNLIRLAQEIAARRGLALRYNSLLSQPSVSMDPFLLGEIEKAIERAGCRPHRMASGAGHDAMILAEQIPAAMVFLRTPGGISHNPQETVEESDVSGAIDTGLHLLDLLASPSTLQRRVNLA
jgi:allantoate deiminase